MWYELISPHRQRYFSPYEEGDIIKICEQFDDAAALEAACMKNGVYWHPPKGTGLFVDDTRLVVWLNRPTYPEDM